MAQDLASAALIGARRSVPVLLLCASLFMFLWMFLASDSLERTAEAGGFQGTGASDAAALAESYSLEWRHGMAGGWPLYTPGFFLVAVVAVVWASGRTSRSLLVQASLALLAALVAAKLLAPLGARWLIGSFEDDTGLTLVGSPAGATWAGALPGVVTVASWVVLVVSVQICVSRKSVLPVLAPSICYAVLAALRPGDFGSLIRPWASALGQGEVVAILSTALIPAVAAVLWRYASARDNVMPGEQHARSMSRGRIA